MLVLGPAESIRNGGEDDARKQREEYFDGIVAIKIFIQIARIRENERQQSARHNLWFLLAYLVMAKRLIGNLSKTPLST